MGRTGARFQFQVPEPSWLSLPYCPVSLTESSNVSMLERGLSLQSTWMLWLSGKLRQLYSLPRRPETGMWDSGVGLACKRHGPGPAHPLGCSHSRRRHGRHQEWTSTTTEKKRAGLAPDWLKVMSCPTQNACKSSLLWGDFMGALLSAPSLPGSQTSMLA